MSRIITPYVIGILNNDPVEHNDLSKIIDHCHTRSRLKKSGVTTLDILLRNSYTLNNALLDMDEEQIINVLAKLFDPQNQFMDDSEYLSIRYDKTLVYTEGSFFTSHVDGQISPSHVGTLLILPSKTLTPYEGGELCLNTQDLFELGYLDIDDSYTSDELEWTLVYIPLGIHHEVKTVESGTRVTFKYNVFYDPPTQYKYVLRKKPLDPFTNDIDVVADCYHSEYEDDLSFDLFQ
jgi:hypothetical protein